VIPAADTGPLSDAISSLSAYDWIVFTSVNGVKLFFERLFELDLDVRALNHLHTAAIGPVTSQQLRTFGLKSDILPKNYRAEAVVEAFCKEDLKGKKILLPRAAEARPVLPVELRKMGAEVDEVTAYLTENVADNADLLIEQLTQKRIDLITFTSSSTVKNFKTLLPSENIKDLLDGVTIASIGPITTDTAKELGFEVHITAHTYTIPGLCDAIMKHYTA
jgi:uroporphyrinogen III methyltransferase/synthase